MRDAIADTIFSYHATKKSVERWQFSVGFLAKSRTNYVKACICVIVVQSRARLASARPLDRLDRLMGRWESEANWIVITFNDLEQRDFLHAVSN